MKWREATLSEVIAHGSGRTIVNHHYVAKVLDNNVKAAPPSKNDSDGRGVLFDDGSAVVAYSRTTIPSEWTPDLWGYPPEFWIGEPE